MPDLRFSKTHCRVSPENHQQLLANLPNVGEHKLVTIGGSTQRTVCRFSDDRIYAHGPHEDKKTMVWCKVSTEGAMHSVPLTGFQRLPATAHRTPVGIPACYADDPAALDHYRLLATTSLGHSMVHGSAVTAHSEISLPAERSKTAVPQQNQGASTTQHNEAGPSAECPEAAVPQQNQGASTTQHNEAGPSAERSEAAAPRQDEAAPSTEPSEADPSAERSATIVPQHNEAGPSTQRSETVRPEPAHAVAQGGPAARTAPAAPRWQALDARLLNSFCSTRFLENIVTHWPNGASNIFLCFDGQQRLFHFHDGVVGATDWGGQTTTLAWFQ